tara:strand:- start:333 stop:1064 length:732 start_codon:yes stop_codon:yes gene_type:complete
MVLFMKKLLAIVVLGLLLSGKAYADLYSNCYFDKISDPKFKSFERKSFNKMTDFPNYQDLVKNKFRQIAKIPLPTENIEKFTDLEFKTYDNAYGQDMGKLNFGFIKTDGTVGVDYFTFKLSRATTDDLKEYFPDNDGSYKRLYLIKSKNEIQIQTIFQKWNTYKSLKSDGTWLEGWDNLKDEKITFFLKCEKYQKALTYKEKRQKRNKTFKIENYNSLVVIIIGLLNLIVLSLLLWRTFRKNK